MNRCPDIPHAVKLLRAGEVVAVPTETVYGLGGDATNPLAIRRIYATKGRPAGHPVIVHLAPDAAWTDDDDKVIFAMKKGLELTITGESSRGTITNDKYTLKGFTASFNKLIEDC